MIRGEFNPRGELIFEIELMATDGDDAIPVNVLLDTGFTGWCAIDNQDAESLGWLPKIDQKPMSTGSGVKILHLNFLSIFPHYKWYVCSSVTTHYRTCNLSSIQAERTTIS